MSRNKFTLLFYAVLCGFFCCQISAKDQKNWNILFAFADDWGKYASAYEEHDPYPSPNSVVNTPNFDWVAQEGVLFKNAFVTAPSCTPCRTSILSGQYFFRTGQAAILQGAVWDYSIPAFPLILKNKGFDIGETYKVWTPGSPVDAPYGAGDYAYESSGRKFNGFSQTVTRRTNQGLSVTEAKEELYDEVRGNFNSFLKNRNKNKPFCYWFGPTLVHRKWIKGSGKKLWGIEPDDLKGKLPSFLPDVHEIRQDFADYLGEIQAFDAALGVLIEMLKSAGELDNTLIVVSGDHGAPGFPRGKCNLYDFGVSVPLAIRGPSLGAKGRVMDDFINLMDLAPTFLEFAGVEPPSVMTGKSFLPLLKSDKSGWFDKERDWVITGRERHVAKARAGNLPFPQRALRTKDYLYIINFKPERYPMGDPGKVTDASTPPKNILENNTFVAYGDLDASPTKAWMIANRFNPDIRPYFDLGFGKVPMYELYSINSDPHQINNLATNPRFDSIRANLHKTLINRLTAMKDPRILEDGKTFENPPFAGEK